MTRRCASRSWISALLLAAFVYALPLAGQTTLNSGTYTSQFYNGPVTINGAVVFNGGTTFSDDGSLTFNTSTSLAWNQTASILPVVAISFGNASDWTIGASGGLTLGSLVTATGDLSITSTLAGASFTNQGALAHTLASNNGQIHAPTFSNQGSITNSGSNATLTLGNLSADNFTNSGTITASGTNSIISLVGVVNTGTLAASGTGQIRFAGTHATADLGTINLTGSGRALLTGTLDNTAGTLNALNGGNLELLGGTINGGTINALTTTTSGGTISNADFGGTLASVTSSSAVLSGTVDFLGTSTTSFANASDLTIAAASTVNVNSGATLSGDLTLTSSAAGASLVNQGAITHTFASNNGTVHAPTFTNLGTITNTGANSTLTLGNLSADNFTNSGTITADGTAATVQLIGVVNTGTLVATNSGQLRFAGTHATGDLGTIQLSNSGRALLTGALDNNAGTLNAFTGGNLELLGGTISGGTINALTTTTSGGTISNADFGGTLASVTSSSAVLSGTVDFLGTSTTTFANASDLTIAAASTVTVNNGATLSGDLTLTSSAAGASLINQGAITHTFASNNGTVHAPTFTNLGAITNTGTNSTLTLGNLSADNFTNAGTITADGNAATVQLIGVVNTGTLVATNSGQLRFAGTHATGDLGTIQLSNSGRALLTGTLDNSVATLNAFTGGNLELLGGTINGGTINALTTTTTGGTINNATFTGTLALPTSTSATLGGTVTFNGVAVTFSNASDLLMAAAALVTVESGSTLTGDLSFVSVQPGVFFVNRGVMTHNVASNNGQVMAVNFHNEGAIINSAANATLTLGNLSSDNFQNKVASSITADSGIINLIGVENFGTLVATNSGQLRFAGVHATNELGTIQLSNSGRALLTGTLNNNAGTLNAFTGGNLELLGGTVSGGTINALTTTTTGGTISNASFGGTLTSATSGSAVLSGTVNFLGTSSTTFANASDLTIAAASTVTVNNGATLSGDLTLTSSAAGASLVNQGAISHTFASNNGTVHAPTFTNSGTITNTGTNSTLTLGSLSADNFTNSGTITADGSAATIQLIGVVNSGTLVATNSGQLRFAGTHATGDLGTVQISNSGRAFLTGTLDNNAGTLNAFSGGNLELLGGTVSGGTINALTTTTTGGTISNASFGGTLNSATSSSAVLSGTVNFLGTSSTTFANASDLTIAAASTVTVNGGAAISGDLTITSSAAGASLINQGAITHTFASNNGTVHAPTFTNSGTITNTGTNSTLTLGSLSADNFTNSGTITADGSAANIQLIGVVNTGTLVATNSGQLRFAGTHATGDLGTIQLFNSGRALLTGTLDNSAGTLNAFTGGNLELLGGTVNGGTINVLSTTTSGGTINNADIIGLLGLPTSSTATLGGTVDFLGATVNFSNASDLNIAAGGTVTIGAGSALTGDIVLTSTAAGASIINQASITHTTPSNSGQLWAPTLTNLGAITINATNSTLSVGNTGVTTNAAGGSFTQLAGNLALAGTFNNQGLIQVTAGTLQSGTGLHNQSTGVIMGAGTISGDLFMDGGALAPGNSIGTLTFANSDFSVTAPATLQVELSGSTADALVFANPTSVVNLGTGLLDLSLQLLSAPTIGHTFNLVTISSGGSGITGSFVGLANSGDSLFASFGGTPYQFTVTYQVNAVSITALQAVPEPGTYALFALGLTVLGVGAWRRRNSAPTRSRA